MAIISDKFIKLNYEHFHGKLLAVVAQKNIFYWSIHIIRVVICIRINISWMECIKLITTTTIFMMSLFNLAITSYLKSCSFLSLINKMNEHHQVLMEWQIVPKIYIYNRKISKLIIIIVGWTYNIHMTNLLHSPCKLLLLLLLLACRWKEHSSFAYHMRGIISGAWERKIIIYYGPLST